MSYSNGRISEPVNIKDIQQCLGSDSPDLGVLCEHSNVNMWAKCKPIKAAKKEDLNYAASEQVTNYHAGLSIIVGYNQRTFETDVKAAYGNNAYKDRNGDNTMVLYDRPTGGANSPYRITDFIGYIEGAYLHYEVPNGEASGESHGDGLPVSPMWSRNIEIDVAGTPVDQSLPDDGARLIYYDNWMSAELNSREWLHVYDLIKWAQINGQSLRGLKRGVIFWNEDYTDMFIETVPWRTDTNLISRYGSPSGKRINVSEFYYNSSGIGPTYFCIPYFTYTTVCRSNFVFSGYPAYVPLFGKPRDAVEVMGVTLDGSLNSFNNLYLGMQIKPPSSSLWEKIYITATYTFLGEIIIKNESGVKEGIRSYYAYDLDGDGQSEGVTFIDNTWASGTMLRIIFHGTRAGRSSDEVFYISESITL